MVAAVPLALAFLAPPAAPGRWARESARLEVDGGTIDVAIGPGKPPVPQEALLRWVTASARAVSGYLGRFPVPRLRLALVTGQRGRIGFGTTRGGDVASIRISIGPDASDRDLAEDWVLTHEMVHLAFPDLPERYAWVEEGLATYVEPIARARLGTLSEERVWRDLVEGLPRGLPGTGDGGLDGTRSWGRTYWGGALFWLLADLEIRERSGARRGLEDALRGILEAGGSVCVRWDLARTLAAGDRAIGAPVLRELHARMGPAPVRTDLEDLWSRLGVVRRGDCVVLDDAAPLAAARRAIVRGRP